jgi:8-oxo-dGTP pyrophosphatase MutT (NUDIX family)
MNHGDAPHGPRYGLAVSGVAITAVGLLVMLVFGRSASAAHWTGLLVLIAGAVILAAGGLRLTLDIAERRLAAASAKRGPAGRARITADRSPVEPERAGPAGLWPPSVVAVVVTCPLGVLAVRRADGRPPWAFPGGTIEPGESPADAAVREVREETGCPIRPGRILGSRLHPATGQAITYVAAVPEQGTDVSAMSPGEVTEARWLTVREAVSLMPDMYQPVLAWLEASEEPDSGSLRTRGEGSPQS